jgi:uncharacterized protein
MVNRLRGCIIVFLLLPALCAAAIEFPSLTGRVVDNAGMLDAATEQTLTKQLAAHEQATTNQVVVATLPDLQGYEIEEFGYQLGRHWGIGQKGKNNGVLLLVAKSERKVRIEVGYGLEGDLTDAISANIIHSVILPAFKSGNFESGITLGTSSIIKALGGQYVIKKAPGRPVDNGSGHFNPLGMRFFVILIVVILFVKGGGGGGIGHHGYRGGRSGGGGFRGGGGSFGGGGASGRW